MGKLTLEKKEQIYNSYLKHLSYEKTARECGVNWRTVKTVVEEKRGIKEAPKDGVIPKPTSSSQGSAPKGNSGLGKIIEVILDSSQARYNPKLEEYRKLLEENGSLSAEQIKSLLAEAGMTESNTHQRLQEQGAFIPITWNKAVCNNCKVIIAAANPSDQTGNYVLSQYRGQLHSCGWPIEIK